MIELQENVRTNGKVDGQTTVYRTLPITTGGPISFSSIFDLLGFYSMILHEKVLTNFSKPFLVKSKRKV